MRHLTRDIRVTIRQGLWDWHCVCSQRRHKHFSEQGGHLMLKPTMRVLTLIALLAGFTACAKYPVVVNVSAPTPTAATPAPAR